MGADLMQDYLNPVVRPYLRIGKGLLLLDEHRSHFVAEVKEYCRQSNINLELIPGGYTTSWQPCSKLIRH